MGQTGSYPADLTAVTGDLSVELLNDARNALSKNPTSVIAYALFHAFREIHEIFEDEQGIPTTLADDVDRALLGPIKDLVKEGALQSGQLPSEQAVQRLLGGINRLHNTH